MTKANLAGRPAERKPAGLPYSVSKVLWDSLNTKWAVMRGSQIVAYYSSRAAAERDMERRLAIRKAQSR